MAEPRSSQSVSAARPSSPADAEEARGRDFVLRLCAATGVGPFGLGLATAAGYAGLFLLWNGGIGSLDPWRLPDGSWSGRLFFLESVNAVLLGYCVGAYVVSRRGALADLERLRPVLGPLDARRASAAESILAPSPWIARAALGAAVLSGLFMVNDPRVWDEMPRPPFPDPLLLWAFFKNFLLGWAGWRLGFAETVLTRDFARLGADAHVDLLDLRPLDPFVRKGHRSVVIWILFSSVFSVFWLQDAAASANAVFLVLILALATAAFVLPLTGVHRRIVAAKQVELERVNAEVRREREALLAGAAPAGETARLANLIAYRHLVQGVREWPLGAPALVRFLFFLLLGLGSWLGAALVERALESALG